MTVEPQDLLAVHALSKSFGAVEAIKDLSFTVRKGECIGLVGPNGAGKTTAISLISGAMQADRGEVTFGGEVITGEAPHRLVGRGLVRTFQSTNIYKERTVWENVYRGAFHQLYLSFWSNFVETAAYRVRREEVHARCESVLAELGLSEVRDKISGSLPYGYQKMLGLAGALVANPRLMLIDEPAAGLSRDEADQVSRVIESVNRRAVSTVVVDHNMRFISSICDRVVVLHHGSVLMVGTVAEMHSDPRVIEAYLGQDETDARN